MKSVPILGDQRFFGILQQFDKWRYRSLAILFFSNTISLHIIYYEHLCGSFHEAASFTEQFQLVIKSFIN